MSLGYHSQPMSSVQQMSNQKQEQMLYGNNNTNIDSRHKKRKHRDPIHGSIYQLRLLMLFLYRGISHKYNFHLGTEIEEAKKFDDLVFEYTEGGVKEYRLLQAKHRSNESRKITVCDLLTESDADYSLVKYFFSYQDSKKEKLFKDGSIKDVTICTNIDLDLQDLESAQIRVDKIEGKDDILDMKSDKKQSVCYKFNEDVTLLLKPKLQDYNLTRLARRLAECLLKNTYMKDHDKNDIFQFYHIALAEEVINVKTKTFYDKFIKNENLSKDAKKFRKAFVIEIKKQSKEVLTLEDLNRAITNRTKITDNKQVGLTLSKNFGKGEDKNWPNSAISDDDIKDFLNHLVFAVSQPNEEELDKIIKDELGKEFDSITTENVYNKFFIKMLNWLQGKEGDRFLSYEDGKKFFEEARKGIPIWFDMRKPVELFTGRQEQLNLVATYIQQSIVVVSGLGGVGKSELAIKFAHSQYSQHDSVIWINAEKRETLRDSFHRLAKEELRISIKDIDGEEKSIISIVKDVYRFFANRKSLFIFDNAEKYTVLEEILPLGLPADSNKPNVLITSLNNLEWRSTRVNMKTLSLVDFIDTEAMEFIKKALEIKNDLQNEDIENLTKKLHNLPLALQQAVAYIKEEDRKLKGVDLEKEFKISDYLKEYERRTEDLLKSEVFKEIGHDYNKTIFTALQITLDKIKNNRECGQQSLEIINIMAYFATNNVSSKMFLELVSGDERQLASIIQLLMQYSVVRQNSLLSMHGLLQQVIRLELDKQQEKGNTLKEMTLEKALMLLKKQMVDLNNVDGCTSHIISVWNYAKNYDKLIEDFIVEDVYGRGTKYFHLIAGSSNYEVVSTILNKIKSSQSNSNKLNKIINLLDTDKKTPLHYAAQGGDKQVVKILIENNANMETRDKFNNRPIHLPAKYGHLGVVNVLLEKKANVNPETSPKYKFTPLHLAAQNGHLEIVSVLSDKGAKINAETKYKFTPLHLAADNGHLKVVQALLKISRINVNAKTGYKFTPLHLAAKKGHLEIVRALFGKGANIDALDNGHFTPLHLAVQNGHLEVVNFLLDEGANINAQTTKGNTALHLAAENNYLKVAKALVTNSANIDIENEEGKTALDLATERDNTEVKYYIIQHDQNIKKVSGQIEQSQQVKFIRRQGTSGISGQLYEIELLMLLLLQGIKKKNDKKINSFYLATNMEEAGDFDDVILKYEYKDQNGVERSKIIFLQAKHRENAEKDKITLEKLLSESEKGDFLLKKYFSSYRKVKQQFSKTKVDHPIFGGEFKDSEFIIYTNALPNFSKNERNIEKTDVDQESILYLAEILECNHYYKLTFNGDKDEKIKDVLKYSSDCKKLAKELAESIFSTNGVDVDKGIVKIYHAALANEIIEKKKLGEGKIKGSFLSDENNSQFKSAFFEEIWKRKEFSGKPIIELRSKLIHKSIKLPNNFGNIKEKDPKPPFPSDLISETEIKEFLSKLKLFVDQPNEGEISKILKEKILSIYKPEQNEIDTVFADVKNKVERWWKEGNDYLTESNKFFQESVKVSIWFDVRDPVELFTGREKELDELHAALQRNQDKDKFTVISQMTSVSGLGGVGKSELARKYIYEHAQDYSDNVIWINAENYGTLAQSFRKLAQDKLRISTKNIDGKEKDIKSIVEEVYKFFKKRKSLFIFDNAEKYKTQEGEDAGVDKFLPSLPDNKPYILITSRNQEWEQNVEILSLDVFTEEEAREFIIKALNIEDGSQENEVNKLAETLQRFPLALQQAVAYIREENKKLKNIGERFLINDYLEEYKIEEMKTKELLNFQHSDNNGYTRTTFIAWKITLEKIKQMEYGSEALDIMDIIAYFAPNNISTKIFLERIIDKRELGSAFQLLKQYSMISLEQSEANIHRLVQQVTRIELKGQNKEREVLREALKLLKKPMDSENPGNKYISHTVSAWDHASNDVKLVNEFSNLPSKIISGLDSAVRYEEAYFFGVRVLKLLENVLKKDHPDTLSVKSNIALTLNNQGKYNEALQIYLDVLNKRELILDSDHSDILSTKSNIAWVLDNQGKFDEALQIYQEIYEKRKKILGPENPDTLKVQDDIALVLHNQGKYIESLQIYEEVYEKSKRIFGQEHLTTFKIGHNMALVLEKYGEFDQALQIYQEVYERRKKILKEDHPLTLLTKNNIAVVLSKQGKYDEALQSYQVVYDVQKRKARVDHPDTLLTMHNIGILLGQVAKYDEALRILEDVYKVRKEMLGEDHVATLSTKHSMAVVLHRYGKYDEALNTYEEVYHEQKRVLGVLHPYSLLTRNNVIEIFVMQGKYKQALKIYQKVYERRKEKLGNDHYDTLTTRSDIAKVLEKQGKHEEALKLFQEVYEKRKEKLGLSHPDTLETKNSIERIQDIL